MWGHIDGSDPKPKTDNKAISKWETKDAQIMTWILRSVDPQFILNLQPYKNAKDMWEYLKRIYQQANSARRFQLEHELSQFTQGNLSIQDYYSHFVHLWTDYTELIYSGISSESLTVIREIHMQPIKEINS